MQRLSPVSISLHSPQPSFDENIYHPLKNYAWIFRDENETKFKRRFSNIYLKLQNSSFVDKVKFPKWEQNLEDIFPDFSFQKKDIFLYACHNPESVIDLTLQNMTSYNQSLINHVKYDGNQEKIDFLLTEGASIYGRSSFFPFHTYLHEAVFDGNLPLVRFFVSGHQMDVNSYDAQGKTPLFIAIEMNHPKIFHYLIAKGAVINLTLNNNSEGPGTPLSYAVSRDKYDFTLALLDAGANPNTIVNKYGKTALSYAVQLPSKNVLGNKYENKLSLIRLLISRGADVKGMVFEAIDFCFQYQYPDMQFLNELLPFLSYAELNNGILKINEIQSVIDPLSDDLEKCLCLKMLLLDTMIDKVDASTVILHNIMEEKIENQRKVRDAEMVLSTHMVPFLTGVSLEDA